MTPELRDAATNRMAPDSIHKLNEVLDTAEECGVFTGPVNFKYAGRDLWVVPLQSWYHSSWDKEPDLTHPDFLAVEQAVPFDRKWGDFSLCSWPADVIDPEEARTIYSSNTKLADAFSQLNEDTIGTYFNHNTNRSTADVITFSHFTPRIELSLEKRFLIEPMLAKVIGSDPLERQVKIRHYFENNLNNYF